MREPHVRLIARKCGGWLAVSGHKEPIKIGVSAATPEAAREAFRQTLEEWRNILTPKAALDW